MKNIEIYKFWMFLDVFGFSLCKLKVEKYFFLVCLTKKWEEKLSDVWSQTFSWKKLLFQPNQGFPMIYFKKEFDISQQQQKKLT